jgi:hypothetical protein
LGEWCARNAQRPMLGLCFHACGEHPYAKTPGDGYAQRGIGNEDEATDDTLCARAQHLSHGVREDFPAATRVARLHQPDAIIARILMSDGTGHGDEAITDASRRDRKNGGAMGAFRR